MLGRWLFALLALALTACVNELTGILPDVVHAGAHSGGSVVGFSKNGELLASGGWEGRVVIWPLPGGEPLYSWQAHRSSVNGLAFSRDDRHLVTGDYDGFLVVWTLNGVAARRVKTPSPILCLAASARDDRLITGHADGSVRIWRMGDLKLLDLRVLHRGGVKAVAYGERTGRYASSGSDGDVTLWAGDGKATRLARPPTDAWTLAFSPDGRQLYGGGWFRLFRWDLGDGSLVTLLTALHGIIKSMQFTADGSELATISRQTDSAVPLTDLRME